MYSLDVFLVYFLIFLDSFGLLGLFLIKKRTQPSEKKIYKFCPCRKMAENGSLSTICIYTAVGGLFYSVLSISFIGFENLALNLIFLFTLFTAFLGWKLKLD